MEPLLKPLQSLVERAKGLSRGVKVALAVALAAVVAGGATLSARSAAGQDWQYVFTNLSTEDGQAAAALLRQSNIPYRVEANGQALAVPAAQVYDARLMLATQGLPRGGGVGFELFDRGDLGVSEFTQKVNLRRALEGELARTVGSLSEVKSARVHLSLGERGLYKEDDRKPSATVVVNLQSGRSLSNPELLGIRHLVSSAVPGLGLDQVTVVDGRGAVLSGQVEAADKGLAFQQALERDLERRVVELLEPVVGAGGVVARVTATIDTSQVRTDAEAFDGENTAVRSERKVVNNQQDDKAVAGGVVGAAANVPLATTASAPNSAGSKSSSSSQDEVRNYEVGKTTTVTTQVVPRLARLSVAVLIDSPDAKPVSAEMLARYTELARRAVGYDEARGDQFQLSAAALNRANAGDATLAPPPATLLPTWAWIAGAALLAVVALVAAVVVLRGRKPKKAPLPVLKPGARVAEIEAQLERDTAAITGEVKPLDAKALPEPTKPEVPVKDPQQLMRERAQKLALEKPDRAAHLIRAWLSADLDAQKEASKNA